LAAALWEFWWFGGHLNEGLERLERALARGEEAPTAIQAWAREGAGVLAHFAGDDERAVAHLEIGQALYRAAADRRGIAGTLYSLGVIAEDRGTFDQATDFLTEAANLSRGLGDRRSEAFSIVHLGMVAYGQRELDQAIAHSGSGIALAREIGSNAGVVLGTFCLALTAIERGEHTQATACFQEIVSWLDGSGVFTGTWQRRLVDGLDRTLSGVALLAAELGQSSRAALLFGAAAYVREMNGLSLALPERTPFEQALRRLHRAMTPEAFAAAWAAGQEMAPDQVRAELAAALAADAQSDARKHVRPSIARMTPRQFEVLRLLANGYSDRQIADALSVSLRTVHHHVAGILASLGAKSRTAAVTVALTTGLLNDDPPGP
jgi:ATP/maltotriose-dependent transcriptional regulator MalT